MMPSTGLQSSEGKLTLIAFIVGTVLEGAAIPLLDKLSAAQPQLAWVPIALVGAGILVQVASLLGYQKQRTLLKVAQFGGAKDVPGAGQSPDQAKEQFMVAALAAARATQPPGGVKAPPD